MAKAKTKLTIDIFRPTRLILHLIPSLRIVPILEGSPVRKPNNIPEEPLIPSPPEFNVAENIQQVIDDLKKQDKGNKPILEPQSYEPTAKKFEGWSQEHIDQSLDESIRIKLLKTTQIQC